MGLKDYSCSKIDCYASANNDQCLLKKKLSIFCLDYYPKIKSDNDEIFSHLFHKHNLATRKYSIFAILISTITLVITCYTTFASSNASKPLEAHLNDISISMQTICNNFNGKTKCNSKQFQDDN